MAFKGMTFNKQHFTSESWRIATRRFFGNQDGRLKGTTITQSGNSVVLSKGYFIACGGLIQIVSPETVGAGASGTKTLCFQLDMEQENTDTNFNQGSFVYITGTPKQEDLFDGGKLYQMPIATVVTNGTNITSMTVLLKEIDGDILEYLKMVKEKQDAYDKAFTVDERDNKQIHFWGRTRNESQIFESQKGVDFPVGWVKLFELEGDPQTLDGGSITFSLHSVVANVGVQSMKYNVSFNHSGTNTGGSAKLSCTSYTVSAGQISSRREGIRELRVDKLNGSIRFLAKVDVAISSARCEISDFGFNKEYKVKSDGLVNGASLDGSILLGNATVKGLPFGGIVSRTFYSNGETVRYGDGTLQQLIYFESVNSSGYHTVNFLEPFVSPVYHVSLENEYGKSGSAHTIYSVNVKSVSMVAFYTRGVSSDIVTKASGSVYILGRWL